MAWPRSSPVPSRSRATIASRSPGSKGADRARRPSRGGGEPGRLEDPVARLDLEAHPLVQAPPVRGRDEHERPAAGRLEPVDDRLGDRPAEALARATPAATKIVPIQPTGPFDGAHAGPDDDAVDLGDHRDARGLRRREREPLAAHAPVVAQDHLGRRDRRRPGASVGASASPSVVQYHPPVAGLTRSDVEHVAYLARLRLTDEELDRLEGQLNHILDQYAKLAELDTSAIPPTAQTIEIENILREDVAGPSLAGRGRAPQRAG